MAGFSSRRILGNLAGLLFGCVAGLLLIELGLRLVPTGLLPREFRILDGTYSGRLKWGQMMQGDPFLGYHYRPDLDVLFPSEGSQIPIRTTSYGLGDIGFRDIGAKPPFTAITLGDSFSFCDDVPAEACWVRQLADQTHLSIASLGVSGYSTLAEARLLQRYGARLSPKIVLVSVFANDFSDNIDFQEWEESGTENFWDWRARREGRGPVYRWMTDHSKIFRLVDSALRTRGRHIYQYKKDGLDLVFQPWWLEPVDEARKQERARGWGLMQQGLTDMQATAAKFGARLVVVLIPTKEEVYFDHVRESLPNHETLRLDRPYQDFPEFCRKSGVVCCNTTAALQAGASKGEQLYLRVSGHWNQRGNVVGATAVHDCLVENGLIGGGTQLAAVSATNPRE